MRQIAGKSKQKSTPYAVSGTQRRAIEREKDTVREKERERESVSERERQLADTSFSIFQQLIELHFK